MALFAISFRVAELGDAASRRASIVEQIRKEALDRTWEETTSFLLIASNKTTEALAQSIYLNSEMINEWDKLLVMDLSTKSYAVFGKIEYPSTLAAMMASR
jgi:hypothetical protein